MSELSEALEFCDHSPLEAELVAERAKLATAKERNLALQARVADLKERVAEAQEAEAARKRPPLPAGVYRATRSFPSFDVKQAWNVTVRTGTLVVTPAVDVNALQNHEFYVVTSARMAELIADGSVVGVTP